MAATLDPEHLITIGIYGSAAFVMVALAGVAWQHLAPERPSQSGRSIAAVRSRQRPATQRSTTADEQTRAEELARLKARVEIGGYLNGPVADLLSDLDRLLAVRGSSASSARSPQALIQSLQIIRQRAKGVFSGLEQTVGKFKALPNIQLADWSYSSPLDDAIAAIIDNLQAISDEDEAPALMNLPAATQLSMSVGEISIWIQQKRTLLAAIR